MACNDKKKFKTSEASTKAAMRTKGAIDNFLNIENLPLFRSLNKEWSDYAKDNYNETEMLFFEENGGRTAIPNTKVFQSIDKKKGINYKENSNANLADAQKKGQKDLNIQEKYFKEGNTTTDAKILTDISESNHPLKDVAKHLIKYAIGIPINLVESEGILVNNIVAAGVAYSTFNKESRYIEIAKNAKFRGLGVENTLIHEVLHTFTSTFINDPANKDSQLLKDFTELYEHAKKSLGNEEFDKYALTNLDEFIVGLFTDAHFIKKMESIPAIDTNKYKNLLEEIFDAILSLFKFEKETTLYSQAFDVATNIIEAQSVSDNIYDMTFEETNDEYMELYNEVANELTETQIQNIKELKQLEPAYAQASDEKVQEFLDSIYPDSKVKDIVYHGSFNSFNNFDFNKIGTGTSSKEDLRLGEGIYFTTSLSEAISWGTDFSSEYEGIKAIDLLNENRLKIAIVNITNEKDIDQNPYLYNKEIIIRNPNQITVLNSPKTVAKFKEFIIRNNSTEIPQNNAKLPEIKKCR